MSFFEAVHVACGGREYRDADAVHDVLSGRRIDLLIHGGARGADRLAARVALELGIPAVEVPANWDLYGKRAGYLRNTLMADLADSVAYIPTLIAFPGGKGTEMMVQIATIRGWVVHRVH